MKTNKQPSRQAQVAKLCRQFCKSIGVPCKATSSSFSMGDSVDVELSDISPDTMEIIKAEFEKYEAGHFDGMNDIYEYNNNRDDVPQTKYLSIQNRYSKELKQAALDFLRNKYPASFVDVPQDYDSAREIVTHDNAPHYMHIGYDVDRLLRDTGHGLDKENSQEFWKSRSKPKLSIVKKQADVSCHLTQEIGSGVEIREGTRPGYSEIVFQAKPDVETRDSLKAAGFRWSPKNGVWYGKTENIPGLEGASTETPDNKPVPVSNGDKFRTMADKMQPAIDSKFADRQTNTPKRLAQNAHARLEGERLKRTQSALYAMADLIASGTLPRELQGLTSKKSVYDLLGEKLESCSNGFHTYHVGSGQPNNSDSRALALWALLTPKSDEEVKQEVLQKKINDLQFSNIPGYFPTPDKVIDLMIDYAGLNSSHDVLEPNLGSCAIADRIKDLVNSVEGYEVNYSLSEICKLKGYLVDQGDFLLVDPVKKYDRVLMNPPFEKLQDCDHAALAMLFLKPGGRLVSVMSPAFTFRESSKAREFREWLDDFDHEIIDLPDGSFKESGTSVNTKLLIINKD